jgi:hypothetical protein
MMFSERSLFLELRAFAREVAYRHQITPVPYRRHVSNFVLKLAYSREARYWGGLGGEAAAPPDKRGEVVWVGATYVACLMPKATHVAYHSRSYVI